MHELACNVLVNSYKSQCQNYFLNSKFIELSDELQLAPALLSWIQSLWQHLLLYCLMEAAVASSICCPHLFMAHRKRTHLILLTILSVQGLWDALINRTVIFRRSLSSAFHRVTGLSLRSYLSHHGFVFPCPTICYILVYANKLNQCSISVWNAWEQNKAGYFQGMGSEALWTS